MKTLDDIAQALQGYDPQALSASAVNVFLDQLVESVKETETLVILDAYGRVLAHDVISPISVPPHDNSAMDGYAFSGQELLDSTPVTLTSIGTALAGKAWSGKVSRGECIKIMTGAIMPSGLDTVIAQEMAQVRGDQVTVAPGLVRTGDNRRLLGEDVMAGTPALQKGELITPAASGLLASLGIESVTVTRQLTVAYFSTGDEILSLGEAPREGAVYDSNRYTVIGLLKRLGCKVLDLGVIPDQPEKLEATFLRAAREADAIITSGGVSVGEADHTKTMMKKLGDVAFWRIAMRPGRPMAVGRIGQSVLFGLPGNPVAVMVTFLAFVRPALLKMMGCQATGSPLIKAKSLEQIRKKPGRTEYQRGTVSTAPDGSLQVRTTGNQGSGVLSSMVHANGLIVLHHHQGNVAVGEEIDVMMFYGVI